MKLTPSHFTGVDFAAGCGRLTVTRTPEIPPDDSMAVIICEDVSMSWPELRWVRMRLLIVAAAYDPFPP